MNAATTRSNFCAGIISNAEAASAVSAFFIALQTSGNLSAASREISAA